MTHIVPEITASFKISEQKDRIAVCDDMTFKSNKIQVLVRNFVKISAFHKDWERIPAVSEGPRKLSDPF